MRKHTILLENLMIDQPILLLTSTVNVNKNKPFMFQRDKEERTKTYLKSVENWLKYTTFNITLIMIFHN